MASGLILDLRTWTCDLVEVDPMESLLFSTSVDVRVVSVDIRVGVVGYSVSDHFS